MHSSISTRLSIPKKSATGKLFFRPAHKRAKSGNPSPQESSEVTTEPIQKKGSIKGTLNIARIAMRVLAYLHTSRMPEENYGYGMSKFLGEKPATVTVTLSRLRDWGLVDFRKEVVNSKARNLASLTPVGEGLCKHVLPYYEYYQDAVRYTDLEFQRRIEHKVRVLQRYQRWLDERSKKG